MLAVQKKRAGLAEKREQAEAVRASQAVAGSRDLANLTQLLQVLRWIGCDLEDKP